MPWMKRGQLKSLHGWMFPITNKWVLVIANSLGSSTPPLILITNTLSLDTYFKRDRLNLEVGQTMIRKVHKKVVPQGNGHTYTSWDSLPCKS
jgi:hypothetical protein